MLQVGYEVPSSLERNAPRAIHAKAMFETSPAFSRKSHCQVLLMPGVKSIKMRVHGGPPPSLL